MSAERGYYPVESPKVEIAELGKYQEILAPFIKGIGGEQLKLKIASRQATLHSLRKKYNLQENTVLSFDTALTLVDDNLFEQVLAETHQEGKTLKTARHEIGHAVVVKMLGGTVNYISVVPSATYLGVTGFSLPENGDIYDRCVRRAAVSYGGILASQMLGDEPTGGGSDMASAQAMAKIVNYHYPQISENAFLAQAQSLAHQSLRSSGTSSMERGAQVVLYKKVV